MYKGSGMNHLNNIATRQKSSRIRDAIFAGFVMLGTIVSVTAVSTAANAASTRKPVAAFVASR
ncbi:MAG TPA: hypothetical protein VFP84_07915 [Kofleriaceae bacterium]|nr:hypothetical protein [Kofleriaceae bacterium]